jgi:hypothetical protein
VQLGPVMEGYFDQLASFISLARALFGDFDVPDILNNSRGYGNIALFLVYLFVAVFIMLSMFLAILGESQNAVRMEQDEARANHTAPPEYGVFHYAGAYLSDAHRALRRRMIRAKLAPNGNGAAGAGAETGTAPAAAPMAHVPDEQSERSEADAASFKSFGTSFARPSAGEMLEPLDAAQPKASHRGTTPRLTPRVTEALSMRTDIKQLAEELATVAERQRKMQAMLRHLDVRSLNATISRLAAAVEGGHESDTAAPDARRAVQSQRPALCGARASKVAQARSLPIPPLLDVCLADTNTACAGVQAPENGMNPPMPSALSRDLPGKGPHNPSIDRDHGGVLPHARERVAGSGWQRARRAVREHLDDGYGRRDVSTADRRRERAPSMRGIGREIAREVRNALSPSRGKQSNMTTVLSRSAPVIAGEPIRADPSLEARGERRERSRDRERARRSTREEHLQAI